MRHILLPDPCEVSQALAVLSRAAAVLLLLVTACSHAHDEPRAASGGSIGAGGAAEFAREAFAPALGDAGAHELPVPASADPAALAEILAAAPHAPVLSENGEPPRAVPVLGSDTGVLPSKTEAGMEASTVPVADRARGVRITIGKVTNEPGVASASLERAARAQLYWPLVQRCREDGGAFLPPEVVRLSFQLDREGYVVPSTILAVPREAAFADAARCVQRELGMVGFRAPAGARGLEQGVTMDVPSVD
jgi:hypothetical protein